MALLLLLWCLCRWAYFRLSYIPILSCDFQKFYANIKCTDVQHTPTFFVNLVAIVYHRVLPIYPRLTLNLWQSLSFYLPSVGIPCVPPCLACTLYYFNLANQTKKTHLFFQKEPHYGNHFDQKQRWDVKCRRKGKSVVDLNLLPVHKKKSHSSWQLYWHALHILRVTAL